MKITKKIITEMKPRNKLKNPNFIQISADKAVNELQILVGFVYLTRGDTHQEGSCDAFCELLTEDKVRIVKFFELPPRIREIGAVRQPFHY